MTTEPKPMCKAHVWKSLLWRWAPCGRPSDTEAGLCLSHDLQLRAQGVENIGPTEWEREHAAWDALHGAIDEVRALGHTDLAERILRLAFLVRNP